MNKTFLSAVSIACLLPGLAIAESPNWTFVEASYLSSKLDMDGVDGLGDIKPDGFELAGSIGLGDWAFADIKYSDESDKVNVYGYDTKVDLDLERISVGIGVAWGVTESTDLYGRVAYEDWSVEASALGEREDEDEKGYSYAVGVRSIVWELVELRGEIGKVDLDDLTDATQYTLGAYYTFLPHFTVGVSYTDMDDSETLRGTIRYQF